MIMRREIMKMIKMIKITKEEYDKLMEKRQIILLGDLFPKDGKLKMLQKQLTDCTKYYKTKLVSYKDNYYSFNDVRDIIEKHLSTISYTIFEEVTTKMEQELEETEINNNELC